MKSPATFLIVAACAAFGASPAALAQESIEPPRQLPDVELTPVSVDVVPIVSARVAAALSAAPTSPQPALPLEDSAPALAEQNEAPAEVQPPDDGVAGALPVSKDDFQATLLMLQRLQRTIDDGVARVDALQKRITEPLIASSLDLRPHVGAAEWATVVELLYADKCKEAQGKMRALVGEPGASDPAPMRYMWARLQMCGGQPTEGKRTMAALAKGKDAVAVLAARRLGEKAIVTEDGEGEGMYLSGRISKAKKLAAKNADASLKELDALRAELTGRLDRFRVDRARAEVLESAGRYDEAADAFLALYRKSRSWSVNGAIEDQIQALERKTKKRILTYGERIDRMRSLMERGRYNEAKEVSVENAKIRGVSGNEIRGWMFYRQALQAEREKKRNEANELFAKAEKLVKDSEVRPRLYFGWARSLRRTDQDTQAIALYERLCKEFAQNHLCLEATYEAGRLLQFKNEHDAAIAKFDAVIEQKGDGEHVPDSLWRKAFSHYLKGEYSAMVAPLEQLRAEYGAEQDASELTLGLKATYWLAMAQLRQNRPGDAQRLFQETIDAGPLTWYGALAAQRMEAAGWSPSLRMPPARLTAEDLRNLATLRVPRNERLEPAAELVRLGLWKDALSEMRDQTAIHPVPEGAHRLLASIYLANGRPDWAHWIMKKQLDPSGPTWATLRDWGTAFPVDYMELAHEHGTKAGVSPFLVQAIIRQESGFRPTVASWAGAVGLMQLMPGTASYTARVFNEKETKFRRNDLTVPEKNVSLGARYIRLHTAHAAESIPLALAGYNAGPRPLESWISRYADRELDAWVESITYQEARGYVRKVYTSYITYSALYGGELPRLDLTVPKALPTWGSVPELLRVREGEPVSVLVNTAR